MSLAKRRRRDDAIALCEGGFARAFVLHDLDAGAALIGRAIVLNPKRVGESISRRAGARHRAPDECDASEPSRPPLVWMQAGGSGLADKLAELVADFPRGFLCAVLRSYWQLFRAGRRVA